MKTKKSSRKRDESSSSSSSSSSSDSDSGKSSTPSKSSASSTEKKNNLKKLKENSRRERTPHRDVTSKWDSPDDRTEKKRLNERSDKNVPSRPPRERDAEPEEDNTAKQQPEETRPRRSETRTEPHRERQRDDRSEQHRRQMPDGNNRDRDTHARRNDSHFDRNERNNRNSRDHRDRNNRGDREQRHRSRSPPRHMPNDRRRRSNSFDHSKAVWGKAGDNQKKSKEPPKDKEKPNFGLSGKLTEETNTYKGVVIKYSEPPEARKPKRRWRLYPFKGEKAMQTLYIHRESAYLIGRDRKVVDLPVDHPSCSKQHAAIQYRLVPFTRDDGSVGKRVRPYLIDLESANGTFINNKQVDAKKYIELLERDVIKFGFSSREYVMLHENSKDDAQDDDVNDEIVPEREEREANTTEVKAEA